MHRRPLCHIFRSWWDRDGHGGSVSHILRWASGRRKGWREARSLGCRNWFEPQGLVGICTASTTPSPLCSSRWNRERVICNLRVAIRNYRLSSFPSHCFLFLLKFFANLLGAKNEEIDRSDISKNCAEAVCCKEELEKAQSDLVGGRGPVHVSPFSIHLLANLKHSSEEMSSTALNVESEVCRRYWDQTKKA